MNVRTMMPLAIAVGLVACDKAEDAQGDLVNAPHPNTVIAMSMTYTRAGAAFDKSVAFSDAAGTLVRIDGLRFFMGEVMFTDDAGDSVAAFPGEYLLIDLDQGGMIRNIGELDGHLHEMHFGLGVDSVTNHTDPAPLGAPLNTASMWNGITNGHTFFVLDGKYDSDGDGSLEDSDAGFHYYCIGDALYTEAEAHVHTDADEGGDVVIPFDLNIDSLLVGSDVAGNPVVETATPVTQALMQRLAAAISHVE